MSFRKHFSVTKGLLLYGAFLLSGCFAPSFSPGGPEQLGDVGARVCADIMATRSQASSLRVLADATLRRGSEAVSFRYAIVHRSPESFRVDVLPPTGAFTVGLFVFHKGKALWLDSGEKQYMEAQGESDLFERFIGLPGITRPVVEGLLYGVVPPLNCGKVRVYEQDGGDILLLDSQAHVGWRLMKGTARVQEVSVLNDSDVKIAVQGRIEYSSEGKPKKLDLFVFDPVKAEGELVLTKVVENPNISDRVFEVSPPANYERVD